MRKIEKNILAVVTTMACITTMVQIPLTADATVLNSEVTSSGNPSRAFTKVDYEPVSETTESAVFSMYTDQELIYFLVFADGKVAQDYPSLAGELGFVPFPEGENKEPIERLLNDYYEARPDDVQWVGRNLRSGDPVRVESGMKRFMDSFNAFAREQVEASLENGGNQVSARNSGNLETYHQGYGLLWAGFAAAVYGVVVVFHAATALTVIFYLPPEQGGAGELDAQRIIANLADVFAGERKN